MSSEFQVFVEMIATFLISYFAANGELSLLFKKIFKLSHVNSIGKNGAKIDSRRKSSVKESFKTSAKH